ncbi:PREDICTED: uncharacterized protein C9orf43 homolog [Thamnophis sirtalis]|uniref:Uncharacterized protein C9orf43 homolog n=1 Tax=Thamnophis sirtalis TaxID=35019 RepID=A0A6I9YCI4_9SAUR|nr:PREDICTED: uncharacterized protein C9orf43 homolog [Thamnophis sirtalis]
MGIVNIGAQWDETICNMIACQHPPCWESMRRIESGHPHLLLKNVVRPGKDSPASEGKLPTLKIVDLPLHYPRREQFKCLGSFEFNSKTISSSKEARNCFSKSILNNDWIPPISVLSSEKNHFPGLNSRMESQSLHFPPISLTSSRQPEKMQVTDLSEFVVQRLGSQAPCGSTVFRWVPDMRPRFLQSGNPSGREKATPPKICVKDLALESLCSLQDHQGTKRKKSNKIPTGGQPYFRHLRRNQKSNNKSSSVGQQRSMDDSLLGTRKHPLPALHLLLQNAEGLTQESKRARALLETKEKLAAPFIVQKAPRFNLSEAKIPIKDKDPGRSLGRQPKIISGGCDSFPYCLPKANSSYRRYCEHLPNWKEATPAERDASDISREVWPKEDSQEAARTFAPLQSPGPPPPSPTLSENSPNSAPGFT